MEDGPKDAAAAAPAPAPAEKKTKRTEIKKRTIRKDAAVKCETLGLRKKEIEHMVELELQMAAEDMLAVETAEAKNHLETYQYTMRDKLTAAVYGNEKSLALFGEEKDVAAFLKKLEEVRDWLYDEGEDQTKGVYTQKLAELKAIGDNYVRRKTEFDMRPAAIADLEARVRFWSCAAAADNKDDKYSHIEPAEREKVRTRCVETGAWLTEQRNKQDALPLYTEPTLTVAVLTSKRSQLDTFASSIMNKPKPPPPKPAETKPAADAEKPAAADTKPAAEEQPPMTDEPAPAATATEEQPKMV